jgi:YVTN family beta-propeller protein
LATPFAYIPNHGGSDVSVIDTATNTVTKTIAVGLHPYGVAVNHTSTRVYVTNEGSNTVSVIDTATNTVTATVSVGVTPEGIAVSPDGMWVYVANWNSNSVSVINATTLTTATVAVVRNPAGVAVHPTGTTVYVTNEGVGPPYVGTDCMVSVIDTATNTVTTSIQVRGSPEGVAVSPDGQKVYVANSYNNDVSVIDTATNLVTATIPVGSRPEGVATDPAGTRVYVANRGLTSSLGTVSVIDTADNSVTTITVGLHPVGIAVTPDGTQVYVVNEGNNNVMVIDTATSAVVGLPVTVGSGPRSYGKFIADISASPGASFYTLTPCRIGDTRNPNGPLGGPALQPNATRSFDVAGVCGIPAAAVAISSNLTVTNVGAPGELVVFPADILRPNTSALSFRAGRTRANNAVVVLSGSGTTFSIFNNSAATVDFILDVNGYFQ